jgi:hypothetical protein
MSDRPIYECGDAVDDRGLPLNLDALIDWHTAHYACVNAVAAERARWVPVEVWTVADGESDTTIRGADGRYSQLSAGETFTYGTHSQREEARDD